jgi:hypothetical protein
MRVADEGAPFRPDIMILGDSHSIALQTGCQANGMKVAMLSFSGNLWHQGLIGLHRTTGIRVRGRGGWQRRVTDLAAALGRANVLSPEVPVLASFGFQLGRIVPPFGFNGHRADPEEFLAEPAAQFASRALVEAYALHFRQAHLMMLHRLSRLVPVVAVFPPLVFASGNYASFVALMKAKIAETGVPWFDPCATLFPGAPAVPEDYLAADGVHGNARYGAEAIGRMIDLGLIARPGG